MKFEKINYGQVNKRVLVAPLDWGLGHATRCIPIIYELLNLNLDVVIAAEGKNKILLKKEFPQLQFLHLPGYNISYTNNAFWLPIKLLWQTPKIFNCIFAEQRWLKKVIKEENLSAVISDNRMGLHHNSIACIYITHQLSIKTGNRFTEWVTQQIHYAFINKFTACWVPDSAAATNLAGKLSHPKKLPHTPIKYLGPLSRFEKKNVAQKYDLLILLSGPEPQRTIFENLLLEQIKSYQGKVAMVKGLPQNDAEDNFVMDAQKNIAVANHLSTIALNNAILQSGIVIARSGYTTVMDLIKLQQRALLVATPGQTEQQYLADYLMKQHLFYACSQSNFSLQEALQKMKDFTFSNMVIDQYAYKEILQDFAASLQQNTFS